MESIHACYTVCRPRQFDLLFSALRFPKYDFGRGEKKGKRCLLTVPFVGKCVVWHFYLFFSLSLSGSKLIRPCLRSTEQQRRGGRGVCGALNWEKNQAALSFPPQRKSAEKRAIWIFALFVQCSQGKLLSRRTGFWTYSIDKTLHRSPAAAAFCSFFQRDVQPTYGISYFFFVSIGFQFVPTQPE